MKTVLTILSAFIFSITISAQNTVQLSDFEILNNTNWKGTLTYKDYTSGKLTPVAATLSIRIKNDRIISNVRYTYEPNKNHKSSFKIKKEGTYIGNEKVVSNSVENGIRTIVTTYKGKDGGQKATMFITHQFNSESYTVTKEVLLEGTKERFVRNTYEYKRV